MREEYEAWFTEKFGYPPMPQHSRVLDFCWHGYQAGRKNSDSEIDRLKGMVDEIGAARKVNSQHDRLLVEIAELRKQTREANQSAANMISALTEISIFTHLGGEVAEYEDVVSAVIKLKQERDQFREELERERIRLAACGVVALEKKQ